MKSPETSNIEILARAMAHASNRPIPEWRRIVREIARHLDANGKEHGLYETHPRAEARKLIKELKAEAPLIRAKLIRAAFGA
jgi:2-keto-3-deoxy-L-rhamnonate aldolase RhmA